MSRAFRVLSLLWLGGCATVVPLQTASVVPKGGTRLSGQLGAAAFCGVPSGGFTAVLTCNQYPDGLPLPEARVNVRRGLGWSSDVGASLQVLGQVLAPEKVLQVGATFDVKRELLNLPSSPSLRHVLSLGVLGAGAVSGRVGLPLSGQAEWAVPLFYGLQTTRLEWVLGLSFSQRVAFGGPPELVPQSALRLGATVGVFRREPVGWGVQLGYLTDPRRFGAGAIQVQFGWQWDLAPSAPVRP